MPVAAQGAGTLAAVSQALVDALRARGWTLATAESCTGGGVAHAVTALPGSSDVFDRGFVTYSNDAKVQMLGVDPATLEKFGAVSLETAIEMAAGALKYSNALISLAITGVAGPTGGSPGKPVGTVCFAWCLRDQQPEAERRHFAGDREAIRRQSVIHALTGLIERARNMP